MSHKRVMKFTTCMFILEFDFRLVKNMIMEFLQTNNYEIFACVVSSAKVS